jgi:type I restriction-modification system DNA methylase subunit
LRFLFGKPKSMPQLSLFGDDESMTNSNLEKELWQTAVSLRGTVAPAEYKNYVLPLLFMRYLSLRYEQRYGQLTLMLKDTRSEYYTGDPKTDAEILADPVEYESQNVFIVPDEARWAYLRQNARADDVKIKLDKAMRLLEESHPKLNGMLPAPHLRPQQPDRRPGGRADQPLFQGHLQPARRLRRPGPGLHVLHRQLCQH